jgi:5-formyltetrahydrofolate cyclo-ligase
VSDIEKPSDRVAALLRAGDDDTAFRQLARRETRGRMRALRNLVSEELVEVRSAKTCEHLQSMPIWQRARTILGYTAIRREIDPRSALDAALQAAKVVALPRVEDDGTLRVMRFRGEALVADHFGVLAPPPDSEELNADLVDLVLVPALAVDSRGHRLGYGRGFYDRLLTSIPAAVTIALVHPFQQVIEVADMPGDVPVSWIATEAGITPAARD